jgi:hypothetical protein
VRTRGYVLILLKYHWQGIVLPRVIFSFIKITVMRSLYTIALLCIISIVLSACPYKSAVGIDDKATIPIKPELLGTWRAADYPADSTEIIFTRQDKYQYLVQANVKDGDGGYELSHYRVWFSKVNKSMILSFYQLDEKYYHFAEATVTGGKLTVKFLSEDITKEQFTSTAAMRKFIEDIYLKQTVQYDTDVLLEDLEKAQ